MSGTLLVLLRNRVEFIVMVLLQMELIRVRLAQRADGICFGSAIKRKSLRGFLGRPEW